MSQWKDFERWVARIVTGRRDRRNSLSGMNSKATHADVIDRTLYVECKYQKKDPVWSFFEREELKAKTEKQIGVRDTDDTVLFIGKPGAPREETLIVMRYKSFARASWMLFKAVGIINDLPWERALPDQLPLDMD